MILFLLPQRVVSESKVVLLRISLRALWDGQGKQMELKQVLPSLLNGSANSRKKY